MTAGIENSLSGRAWFRVCDAQQAAALHDPHSFRFLKPFFARENTISSAARSLGLSVLATYRGVKRLEALGLVMQTRLEARAGKAIKHYRSVADQFFVPHSLLAAENFEALLLEEDDFWRKHLMRGIASLAQDAMRGSGFYLFCEAQGRIRKVSGQASDLQRLPEEWPTTPEQPAVWADWSLLRLEAAQAAALREELKDLFGRYHQARQVNRGRFYVMRTALAPLTSVDVKTFCVRQPTKGGPSEE